MYYSKIFLFFVLIAADSPLWHTSETECIPKNKTFIHDLIPNVDYKFVVYSKDGKDGIRSTVSDVKYLRLALNKTTPEYSSKTSGSIGLLVNKIMI